MKLMGFANVCIAAIVLFVFSDAHAAGKCDPEQDWCPVSAGPVSTWTAPLCGKGKLVAQPFFIYNNTRGTFNDTGHYDSLAEGSRQYQFQQQLFMQYGITEKWEIDVQTVYQETFVRQNDDHSIDDGIGDSYLFLRYCGIEEKEWLPHIVGLFQLKFPTGKYQKSDPTLLGADITGTGSYDQGYGVIITKKIKPFVLHADFIYSFPIEVKVDGINTRYANYFNYDFGVEYFLPKGFNLTFELNGFAQADMRGDGAYIPASDTKYLNCAFGIGWSCRKIQALLAYQRTVAGTNTNANDSAIFTLVYNF